MQKQNRKMKISKQPQFKHMNTQIKVDPNKTIFRSIAKKYHVRIWPVRNTSDIFDKTGNKKEQRNICKIKHWSSCCTFLISLNRKTKLFSYYAQFILQPCSSILRWTGNHFFSLWRTSGSSYICTNKCLWCLISLSVRKLNSLSKVINQDTCNSPNQQTWWLINNQLINQVVFVVHLTRMINPAT